MSTVLFLCGVEKCSGHDWIDELDLEPAQVVKAVVQYMKKFRIPYREELVPQFRSS